MKLYIIIIKEDNTAVELTKHRAVFVQVFVAGEVFFSRLNCGLLMTAFILLKRVS